MRLTGLKVRNFKRIQSVEFDLGDINILVGENGSGKSSIIQAVHLACCVIRQAERVVTDKTAIVGVDQLDYLPTNTYSALGHGAAWGNKKGTPSSEVELSFEDDAGEHVTASCELRSARNAGISITGTIPSQLVTTLRTKSRFFSAYTPGISGIPNKEERRSKKVILKACSFGDSNVILRNALLMLKERDPGNIRLIEGWISEVIGPLTILVDHDDERDLSIDCSITLGGALVPIELMGTGYLQLLQIFTYVLLFKPGILLVDEPDIHLHPNAQERLVRVLGRLAKERTLKILLTTHSPFIVRHAPQGSQTFWLSNGSVESDKREVVELALGWGAFGRKVIIVSEDRDTSLLRKIVSQWPELDRLVTFLPGTGYANNPTPEQALDMVAALGDKFKVLVHRDRDSLTAEEAGLLISTYRSTNTDLWLPLESDVEAYFCRRSFLKRFLGCSNEEAGNFLSEVQRRNATPIGDQFTSQRAAHNKELHPSGGSPTNAEVWKAREQEELKGAQGKLVFNQLKNIVPGNAFCRDAILAMELGGDVALDLKMKLEEMVEG